MIRGEVNYFGGINLVFFYQLLYYLFRASFTVTEIPRPGRYGWLVSLENTARNIPSDACSISRSSDTLERVRVTSIRVAI